jgi:hypothetical protein
MNTIPGVTAITNVVSNTPKGNATAIGCFIGGADSGVVGIVYSFTTYTQAVSTIGSTTVNGKLIQMISQAFLNGANTVKAMIASVSGQPVDIEYQNALNILLKEYGIDYVVIEGTSSTAAGYLKTYCQNSVVENKPQRGYIGMDNGTTIGAYVTRANSIANDRIFLVGPNFKDNNGILMNGGVTAATVAAGCEAIQDPAKPRTRLILQGVSDIETKLLTSDYDILHNGGVLTTRNENGDVGIMRYLTTYIGSSGITEGTIAQERDYVQKNLVSKLTQEFKGSKMTTNTLKQIESSVLGKLREWQAQEIVNPDKVIACTAIQDPNDPSKANVDVQYWAVFPLNFISLTLTLNI